MAASTAGIEPLSPSLLDRIRFSPRDLALALVALVCVTRPFWNISDPDFFWHVKTGERIVKGLEIPRSDPYSFTNLGKEWVDHEWLSQVLMYLSYDVFGYALSVFVFSAIGLASAFVIYHLMRRLDVAEWLAVALLFLMVILVLGFWAIRPTTFSALLFAVAFSLLYRYRRGQIAHLWVLPPLMALWSNLHGGYVMGLALLGLLAVCELAEARFDFRSGRFRHVLLVAVLSFLASGINPYTYELWIYPFTYFVGENRSIDLISEWQSPEFFHNPTSIPLGATILLLTVIGAGSRRLDFWRVGLVVAFTLLAMQSVRHQLLFAMVIPPVLGEALHERWPNLLRFKLRPASSGNSLLNLALAGAMAIVALQVVAARGLQTGSEPRLDLGVPPYPVEGAAYIAANFPGARMLNEYTWGGYLIYAHGPELKVFVDGRADLHGGLLTDYIQVFRVLPDWREVLDRHGIEVVLFPKEWPFATLLRESADWEEVFTGKVESVFVRRTPLQGVTVPNNPFLQEDANKPFRK